MEAGKGVYVKKGLRPVRRRRLDLPVSRPVRRRALYGRTGTSDDQHKTAVLIVRMSIVAIIIVVVMLLKSIDTPITKWAVDRIRDAITYDFDIDESLGKLKFVGDYLPRIKAVFNQHQAQNGEEAEEEVKREYEGAYQPVLVAPAEGRVSGFFGQIYDDEGKKVTNQGIDILSQQQGWVYAAHDGKVVAIGEDGPYGAYVKVDHGGGWVALYSGCEDIQVQVGASVKQGDRICKMGKDPSEGYRLHFEVWHGDQPVDPLKLIQEDNKVFQ